MTMIKLFLGFLALIIGVSAIDSTDLKTNQPVVTQPADSRTAEVSPSVQTPKPVITDKEIEEAYKRSVPSADSGLSNGNYYTNVDGNKVHSPAYSDDGDIPVGASALCRDGTYSFSQNRRGTCSHHGGVDSWL